MRIKIVSLIPLLCLWVLIAGCGKKASSEGVVGKTPEETELTQQVRRYSLEKRKVPGNLDELVAAGYIKVVPKAPAGKKYVVDAERAEVILADQ